MHSRLLVAVLLAGPTGCHQTADDANNSGATNISDASNVPVAPAPTDIASMLKAGAPQLCTDPKIEDTIFALVKGDAPTKPRGLPGGVTERNFEQADTQVSVSLDAVTFSGADQQLGSVSCSGNLIIQDSGVAADPRVTHSINYEIRPSLTPGEEFVIQSNAGEFADEYQQTLDDRARLDSLPTDTPAQPLPSQPSPSQSTAPDPPTAPDGAAPDGQQ
jgi:hypothetical protein